MSSSVTRAMKSLNRDLKNFGYGWAKQSFPIQRSKKTPTGHSPGTIVPLGSFARVCAVQRKEHSGAERMLNSNLLRKLDMQDLMVFVAVYEQSSVTGVSETLCVSQSTVSYCLKKLRTGFEDELFIKTPTGMRPTYKARTMYTPVLNILESINLCYASAPAFDPT
jgi:hypothetical protein